MALDCFFSLAMTPNVCVLRLHRTLRAGIDRVERRRAAEIKPVPLLAAEAQDGDGFRNMDLAAPLAVLRVTPPAVLVGVAPAQRTPDATLGVAAHPIGDARFWHVGKDLVVANLSLLDVQVEDRKWRRMSR